MPYVKVWIHLVWSTKKRIPFLTDPIRPTIFQHIRDNAKKKDIFLDFINGYWEHVHCLISLGVSQTIADTVKLIKGESSHWINQNALTQGRFAWQHEYFAVGVLSQCWRKHATIFGTRKPFTGRKDSPKSSS
jgi:REP element-mobilizing transposase RayT